MSSATPTEAHGGHLVLRPAQPEDADAIGAVFTASRAAAVPFMPPALHTAEEDRAHFAEVLADHRHEVWVAEAGGRVAGFVSITPTWVDDLFVDPEHQREGVGMALVDLVKALRPNGFGLYVFETNGPARALYRRAGLVERERSDGSDNEERAPDIRMEWPARDIGDAPGSRGE